MSRKALATGVEPTRSLWRAPCGSLRSIGVANSQIKESIVIRGLYSAASGMQATSIQQDVTSHNLTHAVKPGYRREILSFEASGPAQDLQGPRTSLSS
ncbi:MAG: hypothetical protein FJ267_07680, partial [Planctomycetes bacterium]|nr:hypothetical protein [Planctomycetota bacterium]